MSKKKKKTFNKWFLLNQGKNVLNLIDCKGSVGHLYKSEI